jgi:hypothetical protein
MNEEGKTLDQRIDAIREESKKKWARIKVEEPEKWARMKAETKGKAKERKKIEVKEKNIDKLYGTVDVVDALERIERLLEKLIEFEENKEEYNERT